MAKSSKLLKEYRKQRKRVLNYISRARKKGYTFDIEIPSIPKKPTRKDINFFAKITPENLRKKGYYASEETGEVISAEQAFKQKRSEAARKAAQTRKRVEAEDYYDTIDYSPYSDEETLSGEDYLIDRFIELLKPDYVSFYKRKRSVQIVSERKSASILNSLHQAINRDGRNAVANRLSENWDEIEENLQHLIYGYSNEEIDGAYAEILSVLNDRALTLEEAKDIGDSSDADFPVY